MSTGLWHKFGRRFRPSIRAWIYSLAVVLVAISVLAILAVWKFWQIQRAKAMPPPPESPTAVQVVLAESIQYQNSTTSIGTIVAPQWIVVSNELPGTVAEIRNDQGQPIDAGDLIFRLDTQVEQAQLDAARARLKIAESVWRRTSHMAESRAVAELELEEAASQWQQAQAQVAELEAVIARKHFRAPFRGKLGIIDTHVGQYLPAGSSITTLQSLDDYLLVEFMIPQTVSSSIELGMEVRVLYRNSTYAARIVAKDAQADRQTRNVRYRARLDQPPTSLLPGDSVQVAIEYGPLISLPAVPNVAVRYSPQGAFVFMAETNRDGGFRARARTGFPDAAVGKLIGLAPGVSPGEKVVADGSFKLQDGALLLDARSSPSSGETLPEETGDAAGGEVQKSDRVPN